MHVIGLAQPRDLERVRGLLREYADALGVDLSFQGFDDELRSPFGTYEAILLDDNGCVALRRVDEGTGEMKRLYVRPAARGTGLGRRLAEAVIDEARRRGYRRVVLDTLATMQEAIALYRSLGFTATDAYRYNPFPDAMFLALDLEP